MSLGHAKHPLGSMLVNLQQCMKILATDRQRQYRNLLMSKILQQQSSNCFPILRGYQISAPIHDPFGIFQPRLREGRGNRWVLIISVDVLMMLPLAPAPFIARQPLPISPHHAVVPISPSFDCHRFLPTIASNRQNLTKVPNKKKPFCPPQSNRNEARGWQRRGLLCMHQPLKRNHKPSVPKSLPLSKLARRRATLSRMHPSPRRCQRRASIAHFPRSARTTAASRADRSGYSGSLPTSGRRFQERAQEGYFCVTSCTFTPQTSPCSMRW